MFNPILLSGTPKHKGEHKFLHNRKKYINVPIGPKKSIILVPTYVKKFLKNALLMMYAVMIYCRKDKPVEFVKLSFRLIL